MTEWINTHLARNRRGTWPKNVRLWQCLAVYKGRRCTHRRWHRGPHLNFPFAVWDNTAAWPKRVGR